MTVQGPLSGVIVLDLTRVLAGPYCTMILGDLGARVVKVEAPGTGDDSRAYGPFFDGQSGYYAAMNRGKESIALDLLAEADRAIFERLLRRADVLVENFRPGMMDRFGYGWATAQAMNPRLIYASASGFGQSGPYARRPAYDIVAQAMGGIMSVTGHPGGPPTRVGSSIGDLAAGLFTAIGINAALVERARTGQGSRLDVAMLDCQVALLENSITRFCASGKSPEPLGTRHPSIAPFAAFATKDEPIVVGCGNDLLFQKFAAAIGRPEWANDPRFAANAQRAANIVALHRAIEDALAARDRKEWLRILEQAGVPSGPINKVGDLFADPQIAERQMILPVDDPDLPTLRVAGNPIKFDHHPEPGHRGRVPKLDADRARILADLDSGRL